MTKDAIIVIKRSSSKYPKRLRQIADPPKQLYCRGNLSLLSSECFTVVGTRKLTSYGREACQTITGKLAQAGFTIVSGLALGTDAVAHRTTIDVGGKTIAVLAGGVDDKGIGPKTNFRLAQDIIKNNGLLISENHPESKVFPASFAIRDRIMSGLSVGVLVIEADMDSGSLITAKSALDQNRDVFAVPGSIFAASSSGSNFLIKNGAKLVTSAQDIIEEYSENISLFENEGIGLSTSDPAQKSILAILDTKGEITVDELISEMEMNPSDIISSLSLMEMMGLLVRMTNGKYRINKR